jgi:UMF1 family MFS transporter
MSAVMFAILAVPGVAGLRGLRRAPEGVNGKADATFATLRAVAGTLRDWRSHRMALQVLLSFFLINDVLVTIQFFIAIVLSARFGLTVEGLLWLSLLFHLIAVPSTILLGVLADRRGARVTLAGMCVVLASSILLLAFGRATWTPTLAVVMLGFVYAAIQAVFRSLYAALVPYDRAAELFGFNSIAGRLSAAVGPLLFGAAVAVLGSQTIALCLLLLPLAAGVVLLITVRLPAAYADAGDTRVATSA